MPVKNGYDWTFEEAQELNNHSQATVFTPQGVEVYVDASLANLLTELWKLGYETRYSCEGGLGKDKEDGFGDDRRGYIYFERSSMGFSFLDVIHQEIVEPNERQFYFDDVSCTTIRFRKSMIPAFERAVQNYGKPL